MNISEQERWTHRSPIPDYVWRQSFVGWKEILGETLLIWHKNDNVSCFPGGTVVKDPPANAGDTGSSPGLGRSHMPQSN